jgi:glycosyltransferase involved in cell wall biosynthesis
MFFNPIWWRGLARQIAIYRPDRLLVRDLPLAPLAVALGRRHSIPVIADLAEPYPDSLRAQRRFDKLSWIGRTIRNPEVADALEGWVARRVDQVLVVCPEAGHRLEKRGLPPHRWVEVGNTPVLDLFCSDGPAERPIPELAGQLVLFFSGLIAGDRGLDVAFEAFELLHAAHPGRFSMLVVGTGPAVAPLQRQVEGHPSASHIHFLGWVEQTRLPSLIRGADLGLLPFHSCPHIDSTLANKLFEYMALELPIIASDVPPMRRVVGETGAGVTFKSGDAEDLARAIELLAANPEMASECGKRGLEAVRRRYNWALEVPRLLRAIESPGNAA